MKQLNIKKLHNTFPYVGTVETIIDFDVYPILIKLLL